MLSCDQSNIGNHKQASAIQCHISSTDDNAELITKYFWRSLCKTSTSFTLTTKPINLLASIRTLNQCFLAAHVGLISVVTENFDFSCISSAISSLFFSGETSLVCFQRLLSCFCSKRCKRKQWNPRFLEWF